MKKIQKLLGSKLYTKDKLSWDKDHLADSLCAPEHVVLCFEDNSILYLYYRRVKSSFFEGDVCLPLLISFTISEYSFGGFQESFSCILLFLYPFQALLISSSTAKRDPS